MVYPTRLALSTLLLLCIGTGRATWIDSVAVIDAVSGEALSIVNCNLSPDTVRLTAYDIRTSDA